MVCKVTDGKTALRAAPTHLSSPETTVFQPHVELCWGMNTENLARNADSIPRQCPHTL